MSDLKFVEPLASISNVRAQEEAPGVVTLNFSYLGDFYPGQMWTRCKARKAGRCVLTGRKIAVGDEVYRPITNARNRMYRIAASGIDCRWAGQGRRNLPTLTGED